MLYTIMCLELFVLLFSTLTFGIRYMKTLMFHSDQMDKRSYMFYKHSIRYNISYEVKKSLLIGTIIMMVLSLFLYSWLSLLLVLIFLGLQLTFIKTLFD